MAPAGDHGELTVGQLAELPENRTPDRADWERLSRKWHDELDLRIHNLTRLRDQFTDCIGCGCLSIDRCRLANPGARSRRRVPGRSGCWNSQTYPIRQADQRESAVGVNTGPSGNKCLLLTGNRPIGF